MTRRPCKACGRELVFVKSAESGKILPLEKLTGVYSLHAGWAYKETFEREGLPVDLYRSHFNSCPEASKFSKQQQPPPEFEPLQGDLLNEKGD